MQILKPLTPAQVKKATGNSRVARKFRVKLASLPGIGFYYYLLFYKRTDFDLSPADFQKEIVALLCDVAITFLSILGYRGSGKSTLVEAHAEWGLVTGNNEYAIYLGQTLDKAKAAIANIRSSVEENATLQQDFNLNLERIEVGFTERWSDGQLTIKNSTLQAKSKGQPIRGAKFKDARIDAIYMDDIEDVEEARTVEKRLKTRNWVFTELIPAMKQGQAGLTNRIISVGNLVHRDGIMVYLQKSDLVTSVEYPIRKADGTPAWSAQYPDEAAIQKQKAQVFIAGEGLGPVIWAREYELKLVDTADMLVTRADIKYYSNDMLVKQPTASGVGVDFAISKKDTADYTAMVKAKDVVNEEGVNRLLILPNPVNARLNFTETIQRIVDIDAEMPQGTVWYPEKVQYQEAAIEVMVSKGLAVKPQAAVKDKKARIGSACHYIKTGRVLFPEIGCEALIDNLLGFGIEAHDDLADAFAYVVLAMVRGGDGGLLVV
jgi:predicted phage terminase large subunit-like protein